MSSGGIAGWKGGNIGLIADEINFNGGVNSLSATAAQTVDYGIITLAPFFFQSNLSFLFSLEANHNGVKHF